MDFINFPEKQHVGATHESPLHYILLILYNDLIRQSVSGQTPTSRPTQPLLYLVFKGHRGNRQFILPLFDRFKWFQFLNWLENRTAAGTYLN